MIVILLIIIIIILVPSLIGIIAGTAVGLTAYIIPFIVAGLIMYGCYKSFSLSDEAVLEEQAKQVLADSDIAVYVLLYDYGFTLREVKTALKITDDMISNEARERGEKKFASIRWFQGNFWNKLFGSWMAQPSIPSVKTMQKQLFKMADRINGRIA